MKFKYSFDFSERICIKDGIDEELCTVQNASFDNVVDMIFGLGKGVMLAK